MDLDIFKSVLSYTAPKSSVAGYYAKKIDVTPGAEYYIEVSPWGAPGLTVTEFVANEEKYLVYTDPSKQNVGKNFIPKTNQITVQLYADYSETKVQLWQGKDMM